MEFEKMELCASKCEPMPDGLSLPEQQGYITLRSLYCDYHERRISIADAAEEKRKIRNIMEQQLRHDAFYARLAYNQQENVKRSEEIRRMIGKRIKNKELGETVFLKAIECVALLTGDTALYEAAKDVIGEKLKEA